MLTRPLGNTGMNVTVLGHGGAEIGYEQVEQRRASELLNAALDAGLNVIDTAACYRASEELIGKAVGHRLQDYFIFTKCGHASGLPYADWSPELLAASIDRSLSRLQTDHVDLVQLHGCSAEVLARGAVTDVLEKARAAGKTRFIGYSGDGAAALAAIATGRFATLQTSLNIADQEAITLTIPAAAARQMGVIVKRPVANVAWISGTLPANTYAHEYYHRLEKLKYPFLTKPDSVGAALRFTLSVPGVSTAIVGTSKIGRWRENAAAAEQGALPAAEYEAIRARWKELAASGPAADWHGRG